MDLTKLNWKNIWTNIAAIFVFAQTVYPGLDAEMIMASIANGTFLQAVMNIGFAYILVMFGKDDNKSRFG